MEQKSEKRRFFALFVSFCCPFGRIIKKIMGAFFVLVENVENIGQKIHSEGIYEENV